MISKDDPLIQTWILEYSLSPHAAGNLELEATALLDTDLTAVLPYLNAEFPGSRYTPSLPALIWVYENHQVGILSDRISVDHFHENDAAEQVLNEIINLINNIWSRRASLQPRHTPRAFRQPLEIYALLPRTNCTLCGASSCFNFSLRLTAGESELSACTPLFDPESDIENLSDLERLLLEKDPTQ